MDKRLTREYTIAEVVGYRKTIGHIPCVMYAVVEGPNGGKILVDTYNLEKLINIWSGPEVWERMSGGGMPLDWLLGAASKSGKLRMIDTPLNTSNARKMSTFARKNGMRALIRQRNMALFDKLADRISHANWPNRID